jgi:hypothetical protein
MYTPTLKSRFSSLLMAAAMLALVTCACGFHAPGLGTVSQVVNISIPEEMLQQSSPSFTVGNHNFYDPLLDNVTRLELHDGYLRFVGTRTQPDGSVVPGSVDLYLGAEDGKLIAKVIAVDIPGIKIDDPLVVEINKEMKVDISRAMGSPDADVFFKYVRVSEEALTMKVQVNVRF